VFWHLKWWSPGGDLHTLLLLLLYDYHFAVDLLSEVLVKFPLTLYCILDSIELLFQSLKRFVILYFEDFFVQYMFLKFLNVPLRNQSHIIDT